MGKEGPDSVVPVVIPALASTLDKSVKADLADRLIGHFAQLETCATIWTGLQTSGRTNNWSLSPSRKALTRIYLLPLSHYGSSRP